MLRSSLASIFQDTLWKAICASARETPALTALPCNDGQQRMFAAMPKFKKSTTRKYYAVRKGRIPGVYSSWNECQEQVHRFTGAIHKSFSTEAEARAFAGTAGIPRPAGGAGTKERVLSPKRQPLSTKASSGDTYNGDDISPPVPPSPGIYLRVPAEHVRLTGAMSDQKTFDVARIMYDGGARGNPGRGGAGAVLLDGNTDVVLGTVFVPLAHATNNEAEYIGCIIGLRLALHFCHVINGDSAPSVYADTRQHNLAATFRSLEVVGDSLLVAEQLKGNYQVKAETLRPLKNEACSLLTAIDIHHTDIKVKHVPRAQNKIADRLANEAMDQQGGPMIENATQFLRHICSQHCS
eukprot:m.281005 g.281005  ORF g.281005 m.281005 type:complete len:352 (+) comp19834_c0_seq3:235-1290(+)